MKRVNGGDADENNEDDNEDQRHSCGGHLDRGGASRGRPASLSDSGSGGEGPRRFRQSADAGLWRPHSRQGVRGADGYMRVSYDLLGLPFETYQQWVASGAHLPSVKPVAHW